MNHKQNRKIFFQIGLSILLTYFIVAAANSAFAFFPTAQNEKFSYYFLVLMYDAKSGAINLDEKNEQGKIPLDLTNINLTQDTGSGSQFYAKVINSKSSAETFQGGSKKFFLGKWKLRRFWDNFDKNNPTGGMETAQAGKIQVTVPYFPDGQKIEIYSASDNKLALTVDVSKFAQTSAGNMKNDSMPGNSNALSPSANQATNQFSNQTQAATAANGRWQWIAIFIILILIIALVTFLLIRKFGRVQK